MKCRFFSPRQLVSQRGFLDSEESGEDKAKAFISLSHPTIAFKATCKHLRFDKFTLEKLMWLLSGFYKLHTPYKEALLCRDDSIK